MHTLGIDIETYSSLDLKKVGMYRYVQAPDFAILLFAYAIDGGPVQVVDLESLTSSTDYERCDLGPLDCLPWEVAEALNNPNVVKTAWNAAFERTCIAQYFGFSHLPPEQWQCTMAHAAMLSLPLSLDAAAKVLKVPQKGDGKALIRYFCGPCKPTKANGQRTRNLPEHAPEKWVEFIEYCRQDVVVEQAIKAKVSFYSVLPEERRLWCLDQKINDRGVLLDRAFVQGALRIDAAYRAKLTAEAMELTGLQNPNSVAQLKTWLANEMGLDEIKTLRKTDVADLQEQTTCVATERMLEIRAEMSKTSVKKYATMAHMIGIDGRVRGLLQFYGANRTGRWAGRGVQVQNLTKHDPKKIPDLELAREVVRSGDMDLLDLLFDDVSSTLSQLIRTAFIAPDGTWFPVADFSAIEARILSWLASETWRMQVFNTHGEIYEASAAQMFKVPLETISYRDAAGHKVKGPNYGLRQKGKVAELALGYQGGEGALIQMGALRMGLELEELDPLKKAWRAANPKIVRMWYSVQEAAIRCVESGEPQTVVKDIRFHMERGVLFCTLPSGRRLSYLAPRLKEGLRGPQLSYDGMDQDTKKWGRIDTYGGKLVENITQAIARDCLAYTLLALDDAGYKVVMHVHDEVIIEEDGSGSLEEVNAIMAAPIPWAQGLPLTADSYETKFYYKKD